LPESSRESIKRDTEGEGFSDLVACCIDDGSLVFKFCRVYADDSFAVYEAAIVLELNGDHG
jgi:hypothetical protein